MNPVPAGQDAGVADNFSLAELNPFAFDVHTKDAGSGVPNSLFKSASLLWQLLGGWAFALQNMLTLCLSCFLWRVRGTQLRKSAGPE